MDASIDNPNSSSPIRRFTSEIHEIRLFCTATNRNKFPNIHFINFYIQCDQIMSKIVNFISIQSQFYLQIEQIITDRSFSCTRSTVDP